MANNDGRNTTHSTVGTTAETSHLTNAVKQVAVRNYSTSNQTLSVRVFTSGTAAGAQALAAATPAVAGADENFHIPAGQRVVVWKSPRSRFVGLSVIGSAASAQYVTEGTDWFD